jgi:hypothetical protein
MLQPAPTPDAESGTIEHSLWALVDLIVFGLVFIAAMFTIIFPLANLPITYLIPLQGLFDAVLVGFAAFWVSVVRRNSFKDFIHFYRNLTFKPLYLAVLGTGLALSVVVVSGVSTFSRTEPA